MANLSKFIKAIIWLRQMYRRLKCNKYEIQSETTSSQLPNMAKMTSGRKPDEKLKKKNIYIYM